MWAGQGAGRGKPVTRDMFRVVRISSNSVENYAIRPWTALVLSNNNLNQRKLLSKMEKVRILSHIYDSTNMSMQSHLGGKKHLKTGDVIV